MQMHLSEIESVTGETAKTDNADNAGQDPVLWLRNSKTETGRQKISGKETRCEETGREEVGRRPSQEDYQHQILKFSTEIYLFLPWLYLNTCMTYEYISMR